MHHCTHTIIHCLFDPDYWLARLQLVWVPRAGGEGGAWFFLHSQVITFISYLFSYSFYTRFYTHFPTHFYITVFLLVYIFLVLCFSPVKLFVNH